MPNKRMYVHDYTRVGFYMITILTAGRRALFGVCRDDRVCLSPAGEIVKRRWHEIPSHRPAIETNTLEVMPDHLHGIVYVKEQLPKPVGDTIRGFKSGATSELRKLIDDPTLDVWEEGYHDRVIMNSGTLRAERRYIRDNPRRFCVRKAHPALFVRVNVLDNSRLPPGMNRSGVGNLFLLEKPELMPVQVSRRATDNELAALEAEVVDRVRRGTVMVSPFIFFSRSLSILCLKVSLYSVMSNSPERSVIIFFAMSNSSFLGSFSSFISSSLLGSATS
jgi:REP element-mobilizing transposase RayT